MLCRTSVNPRASCPAALSSVPPRHRAQQPAGTKPVGLRNSPSFKRSPFWRRDCWWLDLPMERFFTCLESAMRVLLLPPETMLFAKVTRRSLAILSASHVYTLRPQRLQLSCQHSPEPRSHRAAPGQWVNPELWISTLSQCLRTAPARLGVLRKPKPGANQGYFQLFKLRIDRLILCISLKMGGMPRLC